MERNYIERFAVFLGEHIWNNSLAQILTSFLGSRHDESDIDTLIMAITKKVETVLRDSIREHQGSSKESDRVGIALLNYAVDCHLISSKEEPLYHTIYWVLKEPRNASHHKFKMYPLKQLELILLQTDEAIDELRNRLRSEYEAKSRIILDPKGTKIKIKAKMFSPDKIAIPDDRKVEANLQFYDEKIVPLELRPQADGYRYAEYDYRGNSAGTLRVTYSVIERSKHIIAQGEHTLVVPYINDKCPKCGGEVQLGQGRCPSCGNMLYL